MNAELIKAVSFWLAVILAAPLTYACIRAAMFFGALKTTVDQLAVSMKAFTEWAIDHGQRLSVVEARIEGMERRDGEERRRS